MAGFPVVLTINAPVTHRPFGQLMGTVEINNSGSNGWIVINGQYMAGPYQQNVVSLQSPGTSFDLQLTSTAAPGQTNPGSPQGTAVVHFYPFQPAPGGPEAPPANPGVIVGGTGWGAGAPGAHLVPLTAGQGFSIDQVNQLINLLTGVMTGQPAALVDGLSVGGTVAPGATQLELEGASNGLILDDSANGFAHSFRLHVASNIFRLLSQAQGTDFFTVDELANFTFNSTNGTRKVLIATTGTGNGELVLTDNAGNNVAMIAFNGSYAFNDNAGNTVMQLGPGLAAPLKISGLNPGHFEAGANSSSGTADTTVTFSQAYDITPAVVLTVQGDLAANNRACAVVSVSTTNFIFNVRDTVSGNRVATVTEWMAFRRT